MKFRSGGLNITDKIAIVTIALPWAAFYLCPIIQWFIQKFNLY